MANKITAFTMPKWGIEMAEGLLAEWMVKEGDAIAKEQTMALVETDKITNELQADVDGVMRRILVEAGGTYPVGALLAVVADADATDAEIDAFVATFKPADTAFANADAPAAPAPAAAAPAPVAAPAAASAPVLAPAIPEDALISPQARIRAQELGVDVTKITGSGRNGRITLQDVDQAAKPAAPARAAAPVSVAATTAPVESFYASPMANRLAVLHSVDLSEVTGTGPRGRICKADVLAQVKAPVAAVAAPVPSGEVEVIKMSPMRRTIARRLTESKQNVPHFYVRVRVRTDKLVEFRRVANLVSGQKASINDYLVRACALALRQVPDVNVQVHGNEIHRYPNADISIAVATEKGLITPIVRAADLKSVNDIARETKELIAKAQAGKLQPHEFDGGTFSLSNLGMYGIDQFDAIINPPQGAIMAVGAVQPQAVEEDGAIFMVPMMQISVSFDHRAIDGAVGAKFAAAVRELIENPEKLF